MKSLIETVQESLLTEAQRIQWRKLSDEELFLAFWDHWSGYASNGLHSGTSSNPMAQRAEDELDQRYGYEGYKMAECIIKIDDYVGKRDGLDQDARDYAKKAHDAVHAAIKANIDWILKADPRDKTGIKDK